MVGFNRCAAYVENELRTNFRSLDRKQKTSPCKSNIKSHTALALKFPVNSTIYYSRGVI